MKKINRVLLTSSVLVGLLSLLVLGCSSSTSTDPAAHSKDGITRTWIQNLQVDGDFESFTQVEGLYPTELCFQLVNLSAGGQEIDFGNVACPANAKMDETAVVFRLNVGTSNTLLDTRTSVAWAGRVIGKTGTVGANLHVFDLCTGPYSSVCKPLVQNDRNGSGKPCLYDLVP